MNTFTLTGIVAAPVLPMNPDFSIDWESLHSYLAWIAKQGPTAIAMNMDASEGPALSRDEMVEIVRVSRKIIADACPDHPCPLVSGLIGGSTADAVAFGMQLKTAGAQALAIFPPFPTFLGNPVPTRMIYAYHKAIADGVDLPLITFQFPRAFGPDFPPETLRELVKIPQVIGLKEASFDTTKTLETIETARALPRKIGILTGSDTFILEAMIFGCDGALIGFAATATDQLIRMHQAVVAKDFETAFEIWGRLGPLARHAWRAPLRDYRPRMKELLVMQGMIRHATVRPPQLPVDDPERSEIRRLAVRAGLLGPGERDLQDA
ncbi:MAG TPA: dihydrodipicolinate synthase family protein [Candidatus Methylomirabilis sp.]|nr:dihydrodipicolinate synthase family protein [Candidatus Methylomirabilis sp.]